MRPAAIAGVLFAALALIACAARVSPALHLMAQRRDAAHPHAGVRFPERSAGFVRTDVTRFDREGLDIAANYALRGYSFTRILATLYVYPVTPTSADLGEEFARRRRELEAAKPATFIAERRVRLGRGELEARYAAYALESGTVLEGGPEQTVLVIARWGGWWIKWRVTAPDTGEANLPAAALQLIDELTPSQDPPSRTQEEDDGDALAWWLPKPWEAPQAAINAALVDGFASMPDAHDLSPGQGGAARFALDWNTGRSSPLGQGAG